MSKINIFGYLIDIKELIVLVAIVLLLIVLVVLFIFEIKVLLERLKYSREIKQFISESEDDDDEIEEFEEETNSSMDSKIRCPRRMNLRLRLNASTERLKSRYSILRNFLESYKVRERFTKHRDLYFIRKEHIEKSEDGMVINKSYAYKLAMLTIRRKQLILSLNIESSISEEENSSNMVIETRRYAPYNFNMKVSSQKDLELALSLIKRVLDDNNVSEKKKHKDVDYVQEFSENLTDFELKGLGYLLRDSITLEEANDYSDSLSKKALIVDKVNEKVLEKENKTYISLDELSKNFEDNSVINLDILKEKKLVEEDINKIIIDEGNSLNKKFFILADGYSVSAIKMISLVGGEAKIIHRI